MNNVFPDISDLDRALGRFQLRKIVLAIRTLDTDMFGGAKSVITQLPEDDAIGYALFSTSDPFDTRQSAANRVEAYLYKGPTWHGHLLENHIQGMSMINVLQRVGTELPAIGKTLCLVQDEGEPGEREQYVRVIGVSAIEQAFSDENSGQMGDFVRWKVTLTLSDPLRYNFAGHEPRRYDNLYTYTNRARLRDTSVADAARYYGTQPLTHAANLGELTIRSRSMFASLVPSARTEMPLVNRALAGEIVPMVPSRAESITYSAIGAIVGPGLRLVLRGPAYPGSVSATVGAVSFADDGAGVVSSSGAPIGAIEYATGEILFNSAAPSATATASITYRPAAPAPQQAHTRALAVTAENRRLNWVETLLPLPAPGSLELSYMAQGNWYTLRDNGAGAVAGSDPMFGAGLLSYVTGALSATLGALPDAATQILLSWASPVHYAVRTAADITTPGWAHQTEHKSIEPGSVTITWEVDSVLKTATDDGSGALTGDGTGRVNYALGLVYLVPDALPEPGATPQIVYDSGGLIAEDFHPSADGNGFVEVTLTDKPIEPGSVVIEWETTRSKTTSERIGE
jgi:hypothetical protein